MQIQTDHPISRKVQSFRRTFLLLILIGISLFGWLRFSGVILIYDYLIQIGFFPHPIYFALTGSLIGILFLVAAIVTAMKLSWASKYVRVCGLCLSVFLIIENSFLNKNQSSQPLIIMAMLITIGIFLLTRNSKKANDQNEDSSTTGN
jgi:hypothetical protein